MPAHIWTPWFSALGSKSGFDAIARLLRRPGRAHLRRGDRAVLRPGDELAGLQPRPLPPGLQLRRALAAGARPRGDDLRAPTWTTSRSARRCAPATGSPGTLEFFPEEGKYHADGHRACGVNWQPAQTRAARRPLPGVRQAAHRRRAAPGRGAGRPARGARARRRAGGDPPGPAAPGPRRDQPASAPKSKTVEAQLNALVAELGPELAILRDVPLDDIARAGGELLGEADRAGCAAARCSGFPATTASTA